MARTLTAPCAARHPDYARGLRKWTQVRDCIEGQEQVKSRREKYLPLIQPEDNSLANMTRNTQYRERAIFVNVCERTQRGLVGDVFSVDPQVVMPDQLKILKTNVDGGGMGLDELAAEALNETVALGRGGLFTDYPRTAESTTVADQQAGKVRAYVNYFAPEQIINWREEIRGEARVLTLVVLEELYDTGGSDGFTYKTMRQWRILRLNEDNQFTQEILREGRASSAAGSIPDKRFDNRGTHQFLPPTVCLDANGDPFTEIPFAFIGSRSNSPAVDNAPLYDIAVLNIGHYRNSADHEESIFRTGQPTLWIAGLTQTWVDTNFREVDPDTQKPTGRARVEFGSLTAIILPAGGQAGIIQPAPNTLVKEEMAVKIDTMAMLGARLVVQASTEKTATEAYQDTSSQMSVLASCASNVSKAVTRALNWAAMYMVRGTLNVDPEAKNSPYYQLSTDFALARMAPDMRLQVMKEWQAGALTWEEYRTILKRTNTAYADDAEAQKEMDAKLEKQLQDQIKTKAAGGANNPRNANNDPVASKKGDRTPSGG